LPSRMNFTTNRSLKLSCIALAAVLYCAGSWAAPETADSAQAKAKLAAVRARIAALTNRLGNELKERDALSARLRGAELAITACNSGILAAPADRLFELLGKVGCENAKREYYLTDIVFLARCADLTVRAAFAPEDAFQASKTDCALPNPAAMFSPAMLGGYPNADRRAPGRRPSESQCAVSWKLS